MSYRSDTIATIIKQLNNQCYLPAIQREFVWKPEQIIQLFDSIMRGYPISSFLFWELAQENRDKWEAYKFIDHAKQGGTHNELAITDGVQNLTFVLDGQQRLTSLIIGLKGIYTTKKKYRRKNDPSAWASHRLYLDLLKDPKLDRDDGEMGIRYGFRFFKKAPQNDNEHYWLRVGKILDFDNEDRFIEFKYNAEDELPEDTTKKQSKTFQMNLDRLYRAVWKDDVISYYTEHDQNYDRVLDIFVRANEGGTKLSKSDLLLSMVTSKWEGVNARDEIFNFVDRLNYKLTRKNSFDKDFIMKSCLVLTDLPVAYQVKNFTNQNLSLIQSKWEEIKSAIEQAVDLMNTFGIDRDNLTSANTLIPIIYYLFKNYSMSLQTGRSFDVQNATMIRRWFCMALLNNVFSGQSDTMLTEVRRVLMNDSIVRVFPAEDINQVIVKAGRSADFNKYTLDSFVELEYYQKQTFLALSLLYDENSWGIINYHKDHIFPQDMFKWKNMRDQGYTSEQSSHYNGIKDYIGNLMLLRSEENLEKSNQPFEEWIATRDESFKKRHLIPNAPELYKFENYESFVVERDSLIKARLQELFGQISDEKSEAQEEDYEVDGLVLLED